MPGARELAPLRAPLTKLIGPASLCAFAASEDNCHPWSFDRLMWMHNGGISDFHRIKRALQAELSEDLFLFPTGNTDSEWAFALFLSKVKRGREGARDDLKADLLQPRCALSSSLTRTPRRSRHSSCAQLCSPRSGRSTSCLGMRGSRARTCSISASRMARRWWRRDMRRRERRRHLMQNHRRRRPRAHRRRQQSRPQRPAYSFRAGQRLKSTRRAGIIGWSGQTSGEHQISSRRDLRQGATRMLTQSVLPPRCRTAKTSS